MKIGIDISQVVYEGTGVARYTGNLIKAICEHDTENDYTFFFSSLRRSVQKDIQRLIQKKHRLVTIKLPPTALDILWNRFHNLPIETFIGEHDIFISSDWTQPSSKAKKVTIVHDLVYLRYPETVHPKILDVQKRRLAWVKKEVDLIIADSNATKLDLVELLSIPQDKIHVVYPAVKVTAPTEDHINKVAAKYEIQNTKYVLSVGKLEPRKNIPRLIEAFVKANLKDIDLLIVGPKGWEKPAKYEIPNTKYENVKFLGFVPDEDLYALYSEAEFFIYPSLYEGFGYPVVEAMSLGCPVATSNTSSLKEIGQDCAMLFDPHNTEEITKALIRLADSTKLRQDLVKKGQKRAHDFNLKAFFATLTKTLQGV